MTADMGSRNSGRIAGFNAFGAQNASTGRDVQEYLQSVREHSREQVHDTAEPTDLSEEALANIEGPMRRWSWIEVDLSAIRNNVMVAKRRLTPGCRLMAIVKADAYGHGAIVVARTALSAGASQLGVATVNEAIELREAGIDAPILLLSEPPISSVPLLLAYHITPSVYTAEFAISYAEEADAHGLRAPFHLAVNTGMNRIGVRYNEVIEFLHQISFHRALSQEGTFTHFATADSSETLDFTMQFNRFKETITNIRSAGFDPGLVHCANSAALLRYPDTHFDMARFGMAMYGYHPCDETRGHFDLRPAMSVHARITAVNTPPMSEGVSYGMNYRSPGSVKICAIPVGYADGYARALSGRASVVYNGRLCRQVGNICMDQCMFEVDMRSYGTQRRLDPQIGDEVLLVGSQGGVSVHMEDLTDLLDTIPHEICCVMALRMPRVYVR